MSQKLFLDYFESLGAEKLNQLYGKHPTCCLFFYRILPHLAQYIVQRLLLIDGPVPFQTEVRSWHPSSLKVLQNKALWKLKQLHIIHGKANEIWLNPIFREGLLKAITAADTFWTGYPLLESKDLVEDHFQKSWNGVLYCVASGGLSHENYTKISPQIQTILLHSGLLVKEKNAIRITNQGFQFLLADSAEQISSLITQYLLDTPSEQLTDTLHLLINISLCTPGYFYETSLLSAAENSALKFYSDIGLLWLTRSSNRSGFMVTKLAKAISYTGEMPLMLTKEDGFLIVETNYKFYAYTDSPLHLSILKLFMRIKTRFPNMVHGQLTQDSIQEAFKKGISAAQIIKFLNSSVHAIMRSNNPILPPTIIDQVNLWEQDRNRLRAKPGYILRQFLSSNDYEKVLAEANRLSPVLYGNSATRTIVVAPEIIPQIRTFIKENIR